MPNIITIATKALQEAIQSGVNTLTDRLTADRAGNLDKLDTNIGSRASQTSVNSILSHFPINVVDWTEKTPYIFAMEPTSTTQTLIDVTGSGVAIVAWSAGSTSTRSGLVKVTVDGTILFSHSDYHPHTNGPCYFGGGSIRSNIAIEDNIGQFKYDSGTFDQPLNPVPWIGFKNSFKLECRCSATGSAIGGVVII